MSIRDAEASDIPRIVEMGRRFFEASEHRGTYSPDMMAATAQNLIGSPQGVLLISDAGMCGALVYPLYMTGEMAAQELFWWAEDGEGRALLATLEARTGALGARSLTMIALDGMRCAAVDALYRRKGYRPLEHSYIKEL